MVSIPLKGLWRELQLPHSVQSDSNSNKLQFTSLRIQEARRYSVEIQDTAHFDGNVLLLFSQLGKGVLLLVSTGTISPRGEGFLFYAILFSVLVGLKWRPLNSLSSGKRECGPYPACVSLHHLCAEGVWGFVRSPKPLKRGAACSLQGPPSSCMHRGIIRKDRVSANSIWILKGELSELQKQAGRWETEPPLSISLLRWRGEWTSPSSLYRELPSLRSRGILGGKTVTRFRRLSKSAGAHVFGRSEGVAAWRTFVGQCRSFFENVQVDWIGFFCYLIVLKGAAAELRKRTLAMQVVCLLVVLFAMLVMLGVPKDHKGPHGDRQPVGVQKPHWCKQLPRTSPHQDRQTLRHTHHRLNKCKPVFHSK